MKKKVIIVAVIAVVLVAVVVAVAIFSGDSSETEMKHSGEVFYHIPEGSEEGPDLSKIGVFKVDSISELEAFADENLLVLQSSDDPTVFAMGGIDVLGQSVEIFIQTNEDGSFLRVDGNCSVEMSDKKSLDELKMHISTLEYVISQIFGVDAVEYSVYDRDGAEIISDSENLVEKVLKEKAILGVSVVDKDGSYWDCKAFLEKDNIMIEFFHSYQKDLYEFESADIVLN